MTIKQFNAECLTRAITPAIALENAALTQALRDRDDTEVIRILDEDF